MRETKIAHEKRVVARMVALYCRHKEGNAELCADCRALVDYAHARLDHCPFGEAKPSCRRCAVHCYKPQMRQRVRQVMRFAGPYMLLRMPWEALRHLL